MVIKREDGGNDGNSSDESVADRIVRLFEQRFRSSLFRGTRRGSEHGNARTRGSNYGRNRGRGRGRSTRSPERDSVHTRGSNYGRGGGQGRSRGQGIIRLPPARPYLTRDQALNRRFEQVLTARGDRRAPLTFPQRGRFTHTISRIRGYHIPRGHRRAPLEGFRLTTNLSPIVLRDATTQPDPVEETSE